MVFVALGAMLAAFYGGERLVARYRKSRIESRRAKAEYPTTENDPTGRIVV